VPIQQWHIAGSLGWPIPMLKYKYIFHIKYTEAILSNSTRKLLWFEIGNMLIAVLKINLLCRLLEFSAHFRSLSKTTELMEMVMEMSIGMWNWEGQRNHGGQKCPWVHFV